MLEKLRENVETIMLTPITLRKPMITVDYPRQMETIIASTYTFRFTVRAIPEQVEISMDRGPWEACRVSGTHWWYDYKDYAPGNHQFVVRATMPGGKLILSSIRRFRVHIPL